jgi:hypothetical protein
MADDQRCDRRIATGGKGWLLVRIRCYRPFQEDLIAALGRAKVVAVLDANVSIGSEGAVGLDIKSKLNGRPGMPMVLDFIAGLGGREVNSSAVRKIVDRAEKILFPPAGSRMDDLTQPSPRKVLYGCKSEPRKLNRCLFPGTGPATVVDSLWLFAMCWKQPEAT